MTTGLAWRRVVAPVCLIVAASSLSGCTTALSAPTVKATVTPTDNFVVSPASVRSGEVVVEVHNQSPADRTLALVRLDDGVSRLPTVDGRVPLGSAGKLTYRGDGYTVVSKLDPIRRFRHGRPGSRAVLHVFLQPGRHVLVDVGAGRYDQGKAVVITTT